MTVRRGGRPGVPRPARTYFPQAPIVKNSMEWLTQRAEDVPTSYQRNLKPGGKACIQSITIRDDLFERYVKSTDFIQQYIFPGGLLPSPSAFRAAAAAAGLRVVNELSFGPDYAETLRRWRERFLAEEPKVRAQGFDSRFMQTWDFYLAYCEAAFDTGNTGVYQFTLVRD